jgi:UDPglucose 6-dehydrogenase
MKLTIIGTGYVGLVSGVCFAELGFQVTCVDTDATKVARLQAGESTIYEPSLSDLMVKNSAAGRLSFTTDLAAPVAQADAVFLAVGTPPDPKTGEADLQYIFAAAEQIAAALSGYTVVITKSTVPVGTGKKVAAAIRKVSPTADFDISSNPEFLREGSAVGDFMNPDRIVIGVESTRADAVLRRLYTPLAPAPLLVTSVETAEMSKYASNAFLATKVAFINEIADLCEKLGADVQMVAKAMGLDPRIGEKFLNPGPGIGGSCFPKDTRALVSIAQEAKVDFRIVGAAIGANDARKHAMAQKVIAACGGSVEGKKLAVLGLTFKANTDDIRESPALVILNDLLAAGAQLTIYDPQGMEHGKHHYRGQAVSWAQDSYDCAKNAEALVVLTEWNEFKNLDFKKMHNALKHPTVVDLRNIYNPAELREAGFTYVSVGRL